MKGDAVAYVVQEKIDSIASSIKTLNGFFGYERKDIEDLIDAIFNDLEKEEKNDRE